MEELLYTVSAELHEAPYCDAIIGYHYAVSPIESIESGDPVRIDMMVFITPSDSNLRYVRVANGSFSDYKRGYTKCSRISLLKPEYIHCSDDPTPEWILSDAEKLMLMEVLRDNYNRLIYQYKFQTDGVFDNPIDITGLEIPDYTQLK